MNAQFDTMQHSEQLQEAVLHLEHARQQEKQRRVESDAVLEGLSALLSAKSREEIMQTVTKVFGKLTKCSSCLILLRQGDSLVDENLHVKLPIYSAFKRVLTGGVLNAFDVNQIPEWKGVSTKDVRSALHLPLRLASSTGMLILTSTKKAAFPHGLVDLVRRVIPFSEQAVAKIEAIEEEHAEEVREQRRAMQLILDHAPIGIWMLGADGGIKFINRTFCAGVGVSEQKFLAAKHYSDILPEEMMLQCMASDQRCFSEKKTIYSREIILCADNDFHTFDVTKVPVLNANNQVDCLIGIAMDVTEKLEADREKEDMQQQVLHTQKLESLGILAGGIAHDFNNILTAIMGHASLAGNKASRQSVAVQDHLNIIVNASERAADLCKQMLAYSGKGKFVIRSIDVSELIQGIISILEVSLHKGVDLKLMLDESLPMIDADSSQVQQIMMNLITNANEAIGMKHGVISIQTGVMYADEHYLQQCLCADGVEPSNYVFIEVSDTGCGMDSATLDKVFDPFFSTKFTGRGLGMSAVLGIVRGHQGVLKIYSELDQGATFRVLFPTADHIPQPNVKTLEQLATEVGKASILVVDDEQAIRDMASMMLEDIGIKEIVMAGDGLEAVDIYKREQDSISLVLLDLTMPYMDGEETFSQLRNINPDVKVILSSGYSLSEVQHRFVGKGLRGFVQKPYLPETLQQAVREALEEDNYV